jgi:hypothetical protein
MLGSIKINKKQYTPEEYNLFKMYYCTLCKNIKSRYGFIYTIFLSYDITYIFMLQNNFIANQTTKLRCGMKRTICISNIDENIISFYTDLNLLSVYFKNMDDIHDQNSLTSRLIKIMLTPLYSKIKKKNPRLVSQYREIMLNLFENEKNYCDDEYLYTIKSFSKDLANLFTSDLNSSNKIIISRIIYTVVFFIYLNDAIEDIDSDIKEQQFNPIVEKGCFKSKNKYAMESTKEDIRKLLTQNNLNFEILLDSIDREYGTLLKKLYYSILSEKTRTFLSGEEI